MIVPSETTETTSNPVVSGKERPGIFPLPLTPLEQFLFQCDTAASPMIIRIVLRLTGEADLECLKETLLSAIGRHPLATCRITGNGNQSCWIHGPPAKIDICHLAGSIFEADGGPTRKKINLRIENGLHAEIHIMDDGIKVVISGDVGLPDILGDHDELVQLFQNLVHNAIKYGRENGKVTVSLGLQDGQLVAAVRDEGEGISPNAIPRLTERFYREDVKRSRERGGTGLGLAVVKKIADDHASRIEISNRVQDAKVFGAQVSLSLASAETTLYLTDALPDRA